MRFNLEVSLNIEGNHTLSRGQFTCKNASSIPEAAYQYIKSIKKEVGYRNTIIEKVKVNGNEDITELIRAMENKPI